MEKNLKRLRKATKTRAKIKRLAVHRLCVFRSLKHIYVQLISDCGTKTLAAASTLEKEIGSELKNTSNKEAAAKVGKLIAERCLAVGIKQVAFDRSGFKFHGRIKSLADAAREGGIEF